MPIYPPEEVRAALERAFSRATAGPCPTLKDGDTLIVKLYVEADPNRLIAQAGQDIRENTR